MPVIAGPPQAHGPSTLEKMKMGAMMGTSVGMIMGFIGGAVSIFQYGAGPNGVMRTLGKFMLGSGATFGMFMSIGSIIRTEGPYHEAWRRVHANPIILPRESQERR